MHLVLINNKIKMETFSASSECPNPNLPKNETPEKKHQGSDKKREKLKTDEAMDRNREGAKHVELSKDLVRQKVKTLSLSFLNRSDVLAILRKSREEAGKPSSATTLDNIMKNLKETKVKMGVEYSYDGQRLIALSWSQCLGDIDVTFFSTVNGKERLVGSANYAPEGYDSDPSSFYYKTNQYSSSVDLDGTTYVYVEDLHYNEPHNGSGHGLRSGYSLPPGVSDDSSKPQGIVRQEFNF